MTKIQQVTRVRKSVALIFSAVLLAGVPQLASATPLKGAVASKTAAPSVVNSVKVTAVDVSMSKVAVDLKKSQAKKTVKLYVASSRTGTYSYVGSHKSNTKGDTTFSTSKKIKVGTYLRLTVGGKTIYTGKVTSIAGLALNPTFGTPTPTSNGFTVQISNFDAAYTWAGTATLGTVVVSGSGLVTVSGVAANTSSTATITTTRTGHVVGSATTTATSLNAAYTPLFGTPTRTADGFTVQISNYDSYWTWAGSATTGTVVVNSSGLVTVYGASIGTSSTVTISTTRAGYASGSATVTATSISGIALTPTFGTPTPTASGFTVQIINYDPLYTFAGTATVGTVVVTAINATTALVTVTGVTPLTSSTATITTTRTGYTGGSATVTATSTTGAALTPTFGVPVPTATGFTVQISNFDATYTWAGTVTLGTVAIDPITGLVTVSGIVGNLPSTATITTTRTGYVGGSNTVGSTSLIAALTPTFGTAAATPDGFAVQISNFDPLYTWAGTATAGGTVAINASGLVFVTGVAPGTLSTATITNTRTGYVGGSATVAATSIPLPARTPLFGTPTRTVDGFTVQISNYDAAWTWAGTATAGGTVAITVVDATTGLVTVTGVAAGTLSTATITNTRATYTGGSATVAATSIIAALTPTFGTPTRTTDGFAVQISNFDPLYTWAGTATASGIVSINASGLVLVTGVAPGTLSTATITTTRTNYVSGTAQIAETSLP